ncbi:hypothetical protein [Brevibacillus nitrificans]|uniref:hypothetical protein n=1 Tax=Brevibacillus nitrificans TaxID=651560 RepID=UPI00261BD35E|nr:hypothetical protein [Brevibacillus nitrificans]
MGEEHFQAALNAAPCWEEGLSAPHPLAGKRKSGSRCAAFAGCVSVARQWLLRSVGLHNSLRLEMFFLSGKDLRALLK